MPSPFVNYCDRWLLRYISPLERTAPSSASILTSLSRLAHSTLCAFNANTVYKLRFSAEVEPSNSSDKLINLSPVYLENWTKPRIPDVACGQLLLKTAVRVLRSEFSYKLTLPPADFVAGQNTGFLFSAVTTPGYLLQKLVQGYGVRLAQNELLEQSPGYLVYIQAYLNHLLETSDAYSDLPTLEKLLLDGLKTPREYVIEALQFDLTFDLVCGLNWGPLEPALDTLFEELETAHWTDWEVCIGLFLEQFPTFLDTIESGDQSDSSEDGTSDSSAEQSEEEEDDQEGEEEGGSDTVDGAESEGNPGDTEKSSPDDTPAPGPVPMTIKNLEALTKASTELLGLDYDPADDEDEEEAEPTSVEVDPNALFKDQPDFSGTGGLAIPNVPTVDQVVDIPKGAAQNYDRRVKKYATTIRHLKDTFSWLNTEESIYEHGFLSGDLDDGSIYRIPYETPPRIYETKTILGRPRLAIGILIDLSGSMSDRYEAARDVAIILKEGWGDIEGIDLSIFGHTTPSSTAQVCTVKHFFTPLQPNPHSLMGLKAHCQNYDGFAIQRVGDHLCKWYPNQAKLLWVLADGMPCAPYYYNDPATEHVRMVVDRNRRRGVHVIGVGIDKAYSDFHGESLYGKGHSVVLPDVLSSSRIISSYLTRLLKTPAYQAR